jgi:hypothetical protein
MQRANKRNHHYIYKITRDDGRYYIGMHSTDDLYDGYFGSGRRVTRSIKKHGKERHTKQILEYLPSREALKLREKELVNAVLLTDPLCMNIAQGGMSFDHVNDSRANVYGRNGLPGFGGENLNRGLSQEQLKKMWQDHRPTLLAGARIAQRAMVEASKTPEAKKKRATTYAERRHMQGEKNSQFGTCWVTKNSKSIKIRKDLLDEYLANGYSRGRK